MAPTSPLSAKSSHKDDEGLRNASGDISAEKSGLFNDVEEEKELAEDKRDMEQLFGSDYESDEEEAEISGVKESHIPERERRNALEAHEDVFGDSDVVVGSRPILHNDHLAVPSFPRASSISSPLAVKMPNILSIRPEECTEASILKEKEDLQKDEVIYRNFIRWRYSFGEDAEKYRQTNTKLVQWDDGTYSLFVGSEVLNVSRHPVANSFVYVNESSRIDNPPTAETVLECHAPLNEKFTVRPASLSNKSHRSLTMSVHSKRTQGSRGLKQFDSSVDGEKEKGAREKVREEELRKFSRQKARNEYDSDIHRRDPMDEDFLEDDESVEYDEEDLGDIKASYGRGKKRKSENRSKPKQRYSGGYDEYADELKHESEEEERAESPEISEDDEAMPALKQSKRGKAVLLDDDDEDSD